MKTAAQKRHEMELRYDTLFSDPGLLAEYNALTDDTVESVNAAERTFAANLRRSIRSKLEKLRERPAYPGMLQSDFRMLWTNYRLSMGRLYRRAA